MLAGMDADARRIWLVSPYNSSLGNGAVALYTASVSRCPFSHTVSFLKSCNWSLLVSSQLPVLSYQYEQPCEIPYRAEICRRLPKLAEWCFILQLKLKTEN
jgi:hypothetical protein